MSKTPQRQIFFQSNLMEQQDQEFIAYEVSSAEEMPITPAPIDRDWMDASDKRYGYRCLPLTIANQAGWVIANPVDFTATWDGGPWTHNLRIELDSPKGNDRSPPLGFTIIADAAHTHSGVNPTLRRDPRIASHFGSGVVTISIPYLFRTPPGVNLWVKGPANWIKDGAQALEGIVETDWSTATFTMNWKLTRPHYPVRFARGEPICMVVPVPRGLLESLTPSRVPISRQPDLEEQYRQWSASRAQFNVALHEKQPEALRSQWQRDYVKGVMPGGVAAREHQTRLPLRDFVRRDEPTALCRARSCQL